MVSRLRSWWKNTSKTLDVVVILMLVALIALVVVIVLGYTNNWNWTGLRGKTLYDWLQLLIIPAVLAVGGYLFNFATSRTEHKIASDRQQEEALQAYIDSLSALLLEKNLRKSGEDDEVRTIARVRTLTVLPRLDDKRKKSVLQFLYESGLIDKDKRIVDLTGVVLSRVNLSGVVLSRANLSGVALIDTNLRGANLSLADLHGANLNLADLRRADLHGADLHGASLREAHLLKADLGFANLYGAILFLADLRGANLSRTDLSGADLSLADLNFANLRAADLHGANLDGALNITYEELEKEALSLKGATMPDGTKHP